MTPPLPADLLIEARWIIPVAPADVCLEHHAVVVRDGLIINLLPASEARQRYSPAEHINLAEHILIPGLINTHTHAAMTLMRGMGDDLPLMRWLEEVIWPTERIHVSADFVREGTQLAAAEMLLGGITTCHDMYFFPGAAAEAFAEAGMRAVLGMTVIDFPSNYAADTDDYLRQGLAVRDAWLNHPLISFALAPHAPYTVSDATFERIAVLAQELDAPIHLHLQETADEIADSLRLHGLRPTERLERLGLLGPGLSVAHAVHMTEGELQLLAERNVSVCHNPTSNMKLASGIAPITRMLELGITVGLGTDGAASNNRLDILQEMRHAALLAKVSSGDASAIPAAAALHMATLGGATALGLGRDIGSIEIGKKADICALSIAALQHQPCHNPLSHLTYALGRENVSHVWVDGIARVKNGELLESDNTKLLHRTRLWQNSMRDQ